MDGGARPQGTARAVDRELIINLAQIWVAGGGGAAPPRTPLLPGGLRPPDPSKGAPRPLLQRWVSCFLNQPLVRGSCAAWSRFVSDIWPVFLDKSPVWGIFFQTSDLFEGLGFSKPLWLAVVASGGSRSSKIEGH